MSEDGTIILLIEDEAGLVMTLRDRLSTEGYRVETAGDGESGYRQAIDGSFDLIILDLMLPQKNGLDVCRDIRARGVTTPIIMLTAKDQLLDKVLGFKLGADDYMTKPFEMDELLVRAEALLRRSSSPSRFGSAVEVFRFGPFQMDFRKTEMRRDNQVVKLSSKEFKLLKFFIERLEQTLSRDQILDTVWRYDSTVTTRTVDVHIAWLRRKLGENPKDPRYIQTVRGMGYRFTA